MAIHGPRDSYSYLCKLGHHRCPKCKVLLDIDFEGPYIEESGSHVSYVYENCPKCGGKRRTVKTEFSDGRTGEKPEKWVWK